MVTELIGWLGIAFGVSVSIPQLIKSVKACSTRGLSKHTYQLLFEAISCYLIRAIAVKEPVFIVSNSAGLVVTAAILYLFRRFPSKE